MENFAKLKKIRRTNCEPMINTYEFEETHTTWNNKWEKWICLENIKKEH